MNSPTKPDPDHAQRTYNKHRDILARQVCQMKSDGLPVEMAMTLLMDSAVRFAFHVTADEAEGRRVVADMVDETAAELGAPQNN